MTGGDFKTGAAAAGLNEALIDGLNAAAQGNDQIHLMLSQLTGLVAAAAVDGDLQSGVNIAQSATEYNHQLHRNNAESYARDIIDACKEMPWFCEVDVSKVSQKDLVDALEVTARHGEGKELLNPDAIMLVDKFRGAFEDADKTLFSPTESEARRIDTSDKVELLVAAVSGVSALKGLVGGSKGLIEAVKSWFGGAKANGTAGEVAGTGARNPLLDDAIPRGGDRLVLNQGSVPTCGHNSCGMVLNTLGKEVDVGTLIQKLPPSEKEFLLRMLLA